MNGFKKIVRETLKTGERPEVYRRDYKLKEDSESSGTKTAQPEKKRLELKRKVLKNKSDQPSTSDCQMVTRSSKLKKISGLQLQ